MDGIPWATLIVSALVSVAVSLLVVSWTTNREATAHRRIEAGQAMRALVAPLRLHVKQYRSGSFGSLRRPEQTWVSDDANKARDLLNSAEPLSRPRRALVRRRLVRVFGREAVEAAELIPAGNDGLVVGLYVSRTLQRDEGRLAPGIHVGQLHEAFAADPDPRTLDRLDRELRRLGAGW